MFSRLARGRALLGGLLTALTVAAASGAAAAPAAPRGPHPRLFLTPAVLAAVQKNSHRGGSAAARAIDRCQDVARHPDRYARSGYQGLDWALAASSCGLAWQITRDKRYVTPGARMWRALLEDVETVGDKKACVAAAPSNKTWNASVWRDTGYAIRFVGPHAALAYDWLHDAPGIDESLRKDSRACFGSWISWYTHDGYLHTTPGSNYHAGYVLAKTLIAVATAGEDPAAEGMWREVTDDVFGKQIVGDGLLGADAGVGQPAGALVGGDWPEGWQYAPLSVVEFALASRALQENGAPQPALARWMNQVAARASYGATPGGDKVFVGGDTGTEDYYLPFNGDTYTAVILGLSSDRAAAWARFALQSHSKGGGKGDGGNPAFEALAEARAGGAEDFRAATPPTWHLARGTRNVYARSNWKESAHWAVFTSAPRLVPDHQHPDAGNFVFSRGADDLIVDTSPYGARTTLTGNAPTVDSNVVQGNYAPSQTPWSRAELPWARGTQSGIVAARADYKEAFRVQETPSDVRFALRDWVFLPEGALVVIDRVDTGAPTRKAYLRFRSPARLSLSGDGRTATGSVGKSTVLIRATQLSAGKPVVRAPQVADCDNVPFGSCGRTRARVDEYAVEIPGPAATAVHVIEGMKKDEGPAEIRGQPGGLLGVTVKRGGRRTLVLTSGKTTPDKEAVSRYIAEGSEKTWHVVFDAPEDERGRATVRAAPKGGGCAVEIAAAGGANAGAFAGRPLVFSVQAASAGCAVSEDSDVPYLSP